jgi:asparagine synthase (glutamine-hydrolysing)
MCAISGVFSPGQARQMAEVLDRVGARMTRRGPDGCGQQVWEDCALNHQRLAIIDLNTGAQPMVSADGRTAVVVNGEIYNFQDLRQALEARGHHFVSQSDSEVVLHGYREHGVDIFKMLDGMFAIGIWDAARGRLLLARDRFGKKPLFWLRHGDALWFASSVDAFKAIPGLSLSINSHAVAEYLAFRYVTDASCIYREAVKVPAGHAMRFDRDLQPQTSAFAQWNDGIAEAGEVGKGSYAEAQEEIRRLIRNAVQKRLMSDVPLGVLLSAGIDSSIVAYEMSRAGGGHRSFTLGFRGLADERAAAAETAAVFGFDHHEEQLDLEAGSDFLGEAVRTCDEPLADSSIVATHQVCAAARRHVTVALCGDGGDEAFAGYNHYRTFHQALSTQVGGIAGMGNWLRHHAAGLLPRAARRRLRGSLVPWYLARKHADPWRLWLALRCVFTPEEVQRLAERSADATRQIAALVKTIQTDTQDAVAAMERSTEGVVAGARLSDSAGAALTQIDQVSRRLADLIEQISTAAVREAEAANGVAGSIQHIFTVTEQTGEGTRSTALQVRELSRIADQLRQSVERFKIA